MPAVAHLPDRSDIEQLMRKVQLARGEKEETAMTGEEEGDESMTTTTTTGEDDHQRHPPHSLRDWMHQMLRATANAKATAHSHRTEQPSPTHDPVTICAGRFPQRTKTDISSAMQCK